MNTTIKAGTIAVRSSWSAPASALAAGRAVLCFDCCATFSAPPSHLNQEGGAQDPWMRAAERCTDVTNAVVGAADGAPVRAERAPPLMGLRSGGVSGAG